MQETQTATLKSSVLSPVKYDLIGKLAEQTQLTRGTIGRILGGIKPSVFANYQVNPEDFLRHAARLINEQKATVVVDHLTYSAVDEAYGVDIFTEGKLPTDSSRAVKTNRHIFDYVSLIPKTSGNSSPCLTAVRRLRCTRSCLRGFQSRRR